MHKSFSYIFEEVPGDGHKCYGCSRELHESNAYNMIRVTTINRYYESMTFRPSAMFLCEPCKAKVEPWIDALVEKNLKK